MPVATFLLWFCLVWGAGWLFFPWGRRVFAGILPDSGLAVSRAIFLALWTLGAFWVGFAGVPTRISCLFWLLLAGSGVAVAVRDKVQLRQEIRLRQRAIITSEVIFLTVFLGFFVLRGFWSDLNGSNGEKSMDGALISSLVRSQSLPPLNPFSAGAKLEAYYYFGHLETALLTDATFTQTRWSYNLMCATVPALCFSILFTLGAALTGRLKGGLFVMGTVLCLGTLQPLTQWFSKDPNLQNLPFHLDFFATSRVIPYTINEFPWFTFHQADLHAHYLAFPFVLTTICVAYAIYRGSNAARWLGLVLLGTLILTNTWDFPAYGLLIGLAVLAARAPREREAAVMAATGAEEVAIGRPSLPTRVGVAAIIVVGALLVALPYLLHLKTAASPPQRLQQPASDLLPWLQLWGVITAAYLLFLWFSAERNESRFKIWFPVVAVLLWALLRVAMGQSYAILILIGALGIWTIQKIYRGEREHRFLFLMALCGLVALLWAESTWAGFLGAADHAGFDDYKRQDTVFKFGLQAWFLWGIAASSGAYLTLRRWPLLLQLAFVPAFCVMSIASLSVVWGRTHWFGRDPAYASWQSFDGWAHLAPPEKEAASWLLQNTAPGENILEAESQQGGDFSEYARYSSLTGIPTVIGPLAHSFYWCPAPVSKQDPEWVEVDQQHMTWANYVGKKSWEEVYRRKADARAIYSLHDAAAQRDLLQKYGVRYMVVGNLELQEYGPQALENLRVNWPQVAEFGTTDPEHRVFIFENRPKS